MRTIFTAGINTSKLIDNIALKSKNNKFNDENTSKIQELVDAEYSMVAGGPQVKNEPRQQ